jgi:hypothetical protein
LKKVSLSGRATFVLAIVIIGVIVLGAALLVFVKPSIDRSSVAIEETGLSNGDVFKYDIAGNYHGSSVTGSLLATYMANNGYSTAVTAMSDADLNSTFFDHSPLSLFGTGSEVGTGKFTSSFGIKEVVWMFMVDNGWATVDYVGTNPGISYGISVNGPNVHLIITLLETANQWVKVNNTAPLVLLPKPLPTDSNEGGIGGIDSAGVNSGEVIFTNGGGRLNYSLNATDVDVLAFSDGNIRSMAEGGPFAYDPSLYRLHSGDMNGIVDLPRGFYFIFFTGHTIRNESMSHFLWTMERY